MYSFMRLCLLHKVFLKRIAIAVIIISAFLFLYKRPRGEITNKLWDSVAKRRAKRDVYSYSQLVRANVMKYKNLTLPQQNPDVRPFVRMKSWYRIAPVYKLSGCIVEKSMCTVIQGIFCYLFDSEEFVYAKKSITALEWKNRFCLNKNEAVSTVLKDRLMPYPTDAIFIVRDPLERFLSGFVDKCIREKSKCFDCKGNVLCTIEGLHTELLKHSAKYNVVNAKRRKMFSFTYETQHMAPQTWYCDLFDEAPTHIFLRYGEKGLDHQKMVDNLLEVFADHGVEKEKREYIRKSLTRDTQHATKNNPARQNLTEQIKNSPKHLKLFTEMFRYDYEIFGFEPLIKSS